jgi:hypothetical protein
LRWNAWSNVSSLVTGCLAGAKVLLRKDVLAGDFRFPTGAVAGAVVSAVAGAIAEALTSTIVVPDPLSLCRRTRSGPESGFSHESTVGEKTSQCQEKALF